MAKLEIQIHENTGATKDSAPYLGTFINKSTVKLTELAERSAARCGLPAIQVEAILRGAFTEFAELEKSGPVRINFDGGAVVQVIKGNFLSSDAAFDPAKNQLELAWHLSDEVRNHLVNETPRIVTDGTSTKVRLDTVADTETPRPYQVIHGRKPFKCTGVNLVMSDEGAEIYLEEASGVRHACEVLEVISKQEFTAKSVELLEAGDYRCIVKSRGGDAEGQLQTAMKKVKYLYIAEPVGISMIKGSSQEDGVISPETDETIITGWGLLDGFEELRVEYTATDGTAVDETATSDRFAAHSDTEIAFPPAFWGDFKTPQGEVVFTVTTAKGSASFKASVG